MLAKGGDGWNDELVLAIGSSAWLLPMQALRLAQWPVRERGGALGLLGRGLG